MVAHWRHYFVDATILVCTKDENWGPSQFTNNEMTRRP